MTVVGNGLASVGLVEFAEGVEPLPYEGIFYALMKDRLPMSG